MPCNAAAYLADIVEACDAIAVALRNIDLGAYQGFRLIRSSVEREFTIIDEALTGRVVLQQSELLSGALVSPPSKEPES